MHNLPERPLTLSPSLAQTFGVEAAVLLGHYQNLTQLFGNPVRISVSQLVQQLPFWSAGQIHSLNQDLIAGAALRVERIEADLQISVLQTVEQKNQQNLERTDKVNHLPVVDYGSARKRTSGPAPTFGGQSGWRQSPSELDEIFAAAEQRKKQLREMHLEWRPSKMFFELIERSPISTEFAQGCLDEFIAYYVEKGTRENNWDQRFLAWVKRSWRDQETQQARSEKFNENSGAGNGHEKSRRDTRENRKRVTAAIMDLKNLDW